MRKYYDALDAMSGGSPVEDKYLLVKMDDLKNKIKSILRTDIDDYYGNAKLLETLIENNKQISLSESDIKDRAEKEFKKYYDDYPYIKADGVRIGYQQALKDLLK